MSDPVTGTASVNGLIDAIDRLRGYFSGYSPDMKSVTYNYGAQTSTMKLKITVPNNRGRHSGKIEVPYQQGYRFKEVLAGGFDPVTTAVSRQGDRYVLNPRDLPSEEEYMVVLEKENVHLDTLDNIVEVHPASQPKSKNGVDTYWIEAFIQEPKILSDIYDELKVDNIDLDISVGVQRCFSQAIPDDVVRSFKRTADLIDASDSGDFFQVKKAHKLRKGTRKFSKMGEQEVARLIRSLASAEHVQDYISVDTPYRRENISTEGFQQTVFPESVLVNVSTNLSLEQKAANGALEFDKNSYTSHLENEVDDLIK